MHSATSPLSTTSQPSRIALHGDPETPYLEWFGQQLGRMLKGRGHPSVGIEGDPGLVVHFTSAVRPRPFRRRAQGTFVVSVVEAEQPPENVLVEAYPILVRSLSNLLIYIAPEGESRAIYFVTLEQGYYKAEARDNETLLDEIYQRLMPLASTRLVINTIFDRTLPPELYDGDETTQAIYDAGRRLDAMNLLPAPFPIDQILGERDLQHVRRLFGIGGLSYGNLSARRDQGSFWMSARGVNKADLRRIGRDIVLITDYIPAKNAMQVQVPPEIDPKSASVDAIEHWALYREHPDIGAIVHVHAWMEGVSSTTVNYPCGTFELAQEVAEHVRMAPDPSRAVVGLKNHGLTITGRSLDDIFERIDGRLQRQVPMS